MKHDFLLDVQTRRENFDNRVFERRDGRKMISHHAKRVAFLSINNQHFYEWLITMFFSVVLKTAFPLIIILTQYGFILMTEGSYATVEARSAVICFISIAYQIQLIQTFQLSLDLLFRIRMMKLVRKLISF